MTQSDANDRVSYLLKLVGKKHPEIVTSQADFQPTLPQDQISPNLHQETTLDSDFEDIISSLKMAQLNLPSQLAIRDDWFEPTKLIVEDKYLSDTVVVQQDTEAVILETYAENTDLEFKILHHLRYVENSMTKPMPGYYVALDANHTWMLYWLVNAHDIIIDAQESLFLDEKKALIVEKIKTCIIDDGKGGIGGGKNQIGHLASAYAAVLALISLKQFHLLASIRLNLYDWLLSLKLPNGSFRMHENGESDTRSTYCALLIASVLNVSDAKLTYNCRDWLNTCQTFEGGFAGTPDTEAHGGYTFCALASYLLLYNDRYEFFSEESFDLPNLIRWTTMKQYQLEGGLSGRTGKLVDACYSFWVGATFAMLEPIIEESALFSRVGLKSYILRCSQAPTGGFRDKPGKSVDFYHTNYTLSGLGICEYKLSFTDKLASLCYSLQAEPLVQSPHIKPINPVFGLPVCLAEACKQHFVNLDKQELQE